MKMLFASLFFVLIAMTCFGEETQWGNENGEAVSGKEVPVDGASLK